MLKRHAHMQAGGMMLLLVFERCWNSSFLDYEGKCSALTTAEATDKSYIWLNPRDCNNMWHSLTHSLTLVLGCTHCFLINVPQWFRNNIIASISYTRCQHIARKRRRKGKRLASERNFSPQLQFDLSSTFVSDVWQIFFVSFATAFCHISMAFLEIVFFSLSTFRTTHTRARETFLIFLEMYPVNSGLYRSNFSTEARFYSGIFQKWITPLDLEWILIFSKQFFLSFEWLKNWLNKINGCSYGNRNFYRFILLCNWSCGSLNYVSIKRRNFITKCCWRILRS